MVGSMAMLDRSSCDLVPCVAPHKAAHAARILTQLGPAAFSETSVPLRSRLISVLVETYLKDNI
jgi:hypothetical protein